MSLLMETSSAVSQAQVPVRVPVSSSLCPSLCPTQAAPDAPCPYGFMSLFTLRAVKPASLSAAIYPPQTPATGAKRAQLTGNTVRKPERQP